MRGALLVALVAVLAVVEPRVAVADDPLALPTSAEALQHFDQGGVYFQEGKYDQAVAEYEKGARIEDLPAWDWNLGLAHQRAGNLDRARWYYERFISRIEGMADVGDYIAAARLHIEEIDAAQPKSSVAIGAVAAGPTSVTPSWYRDPIGWTLSGGGLAVGAVGVGFLLNAANLEDAANEESSETRKNELRDQAGNRRLFGYTLVGVGAVALVTGIVKLAMRPSGGEPRDSLGFQFSIQPDGTLRAAVSGIF